MLNKIDPLEPFFSNLLVGFTSFIAAVFLADCDLNNDDLTWETTYSDTTAVVPYPVGEELNRAFNAKRYPDDFYKEVFSNRTYVTNNYTGTSPTYEKSTDDSATALKWVRDVPYIAGYIIEPYGTTEKYFQFTVNRNYDSSSGVYYRVHKLSYIDRTMCIDNRGLDHSGLIGKLSHIPVPPEKFIEGVQYLYVNNPYFSYGTASIIAVENTTGNDTLRYNIYQSIYMMKDSRGTTDQISIYKLIFSMTADKGEISLKRKLIRTYSLV